MAANSPDFRKICTLSSSSSPSPHRRIERLQDKSFPGTISAQHQIDAAELRPINLGQGSKVLQFESRDHCFLKIYKLVVRVLPGPPSWREFNQRDILRHSCPRRISPPVFRPNGASSDSPGQRPGFQRHRIPSPEGAAPSAKRRFDPLGDPGTDLRQL